MELHNSSRAPWAVRGDRGKQAPLNAIYTYVPTLLKEGTGRDLGPMSYYSQGITILRTLLLFRRVCRVQTPLGGSSNPYKGQLIGRPTPTSVEYSFFFFFGKKTKKRDSLKCMERERARERERGENL